MDKSLTLRPLDGGLPLTFKELREFVQELMSMDMPDEAGVSGSVTFSGKLKTLTVKEEGKE
jgi:hypothetical protein